MPGTEPYTTTCKFCTKQIIMGLNDQKKWQPWDNFVNKEGHNCAARPKQNSTAAATAISISQHDMEAIAAIIVAALKTELTTIEQGVSMANWMHEKVAKKLGVEDLIDESKQ